MTDIYTKNKDMDKLGLLATMHILIKLWINIINSNA